MRGLKHSFLAAAAAAEDAAADTPEGELLQLRQKGDKEKQQEEREYKQFLHAKNGEKGSASDSILSRFW
ncbi:hypothetical protein EAH_00067660, partial [Eimeria acervulina]